MELNSAAQTLVIILASFLGLFLLLAIIAVFKLIQVLNHLKAISEKAERLATSAESIGEFFRYTAGPAALSKLVSVIGDAFKSRKKRS